MFIILWSGYSSILFLFYKDLLKKLFYISDNLVKDVINCVLDTLAHPTIFLVVFVCITGI